MVLYDVDLARVGPCRFHTIISSFSGIAPRYSCIQRTSVYILSNHRDGKSTGFLYHRVEVRKKMVVPIHSLAPVMQIHLTCPEGFNSAIFISLKYSGPKAKRATLLHSDFAFVSGVHHADNPSFLVGDCMVNFFSRGPNK
jgi:hypothetical protein